MTNGQNIFQKQLVFGEYCDRWISMNSTRLKPSSRAKYQATIEKYIKPCFGSRTLGRITSEEVDEFTRMLICEKKLSAKTVRDILVLFHSILVYAEKRSKQTLPEIEIIYPRQNKKQIRILNEQEEKRLMGYLAEEMDLYKFGVYLALRTGLRVGELCALRWSDISMKELTMSVSRTVQRIQASGIETSPKTRIIVGTPKSDSSRRTLPLMPDITALCDRFYDGNPDSFVLTGQGKCMEPRTLQRHLKSYLEDCGILGVHFHTLRHTFATRCIEAGFDVKTLSEILGHASIGITMNQYVHPDLERKRENMRRLKNVIEV